MRKLMFARSTTKATVLASGLQCQDYHPVAESASTLDLGEVRVAE
jgi:hypothetical protein